MLGWANQSDICCFLDNHHYSSEHHSAEVLVGVGLRKIFHPQEDFFTSLSSFVHHANDYIFGHFNYEIKDKTAAGLTSSLPGFTSFPDHYLFIPEVVLQLENNVLKIGVLNKDAQIIYLQIISFVIVENEIEPISITPRQTKAQYIDAVTKLQKHIQLGDCYVINYCQEFFGYAKADTISLYTRLAKLSPNPFAAYYKVKNQHLLCASPERFIKRQGDVLISQPIKGTASRITTDNAMDDEAKEALHQSIKDRSENVMVVDLVRNDLSKICTRGSVEVDELFGVFSYPNVHQMISTVKGQVEKDIPFGSIIKAMFPMGSMTGAPKHRVMELTEHYEHSKRGIYSGTVGYITPNKDFDFNVVIRSIVYNAITNYISYHVGSAITTYSHPEDEYEECMLKGRKMADLLAGNSLT